MQAEIHPKRNLVKFKCTCGNVLEELTTLHAPQGYYQVEVCSKCHPFYTKKQKLIDTEGRVQQFNKRYQKLATEAKTGKN